jgi:hypothetical protein
MATINGRGVASVFVEEGGICDIPVRVALFDRPREKGANLEA